MHLAFSFQDIFAIGKNQEGPLAQTYIKSRKKDANHPKKEKKKKEKQWPYKKNVEGGTL